MEVSKLSYKRWRRRKKSSERFFLCCFKIKFVFPKLCIEQFQSRRKDCETNLRCLGFFNNRANKDGGRYIENCVTLYFFLVLPSWGSNGIARLGLKLQETNENCPSPTNISLNFGLAWFAQCSRVFWHLDLTHCPLIPGIRLRK